MACLQGLDLPNERMPPRKDAPNTPEDGGSSPSPTPKSSAAAANHTKVMAES